MTKKLPVIAPSPEEALQHLESTFPGSRYVSTNTMIAHDESTAHAIERAVISSCWSQDHVLGIVVTLKSMSQGLGVTFHLALPAALQ